MRQSLVIGNWKMHGSLSWNEGLLSELLPLVGAMQNPAVVVCPPTVYLAGVYDRIRSSCVALGAQNVCAEATDEGAYTGEIAARMLADVGVSYVLIGHSERRQHYGECDEIVASKFVRAQSAGLVPVLCVGENLAQREQGQTLAVVASQIMAVVATTGVAAFARAVIAYEPVWAIGTGKTASPEQAQEVHAHIRKLLAGLDGDIAAKVQLLYGGSVKADNAAGLFVKADIDGALVGGASLSAKEFYEICKAVG